MAGYFTNRGKFLLLGYVFRGTTLPTNLYVALVTDGSAPSADIDTLSQLTQIQTGNGYSDGGFQLTPNSTDFDSLTQNNTDDRAALQLKTVSWTASGGSIPSSGDSARYAVLTDDNVTVGSRQVFFIWDLSVDRAAANGEAINLNDLEVRLA